MITIQGKGVSAGVGVGPLYYYRRATAEIKRYTVEDTDAEWHRFKGAQTGAVEQLGQLVTVFFIVRVVHRKRRKKTVKSGKKENGAAG